MSHRGDGPYSWTRWTDRFGRPTPFFYQLILDLWNKADDLDKAQDDTALAQIAALRKDFEELGLDFGLEVAKGNVPGHSAINKYGKNTNIASGTTAAVWSAGLVGGNLIWDAPTAARTHTISSDDADDTTGGAGARTVEVFGLTSWSTSEVSETVTMNTASPPVTNNSYVIIHRMKVITSGGTAGANQGTIIATATDDATVTAEILPLEGQTMMAIYGISSLESIYINELGAVVGKAGGAATGFVDIDLLVNPEPDSQLAAFTHKHHFGLSAAGSSGLVVPFNPPKCIAGPAIIKVQADSGTNGMDVGAWFNGTVITNGF